MSSSQIFPHNSSKRKRSDASERASDRSSPSYADEVSADFKDALQDLTGNDRYQINNLTVIAKESVDGETEDSPNAHAIANVLVNHIAKAAPVRKLPALYVLDSIVKNVGNPYIRIFESQLYKIFIGAYALVDPQTRKQMESMLRTWKEPIPGAREPGPLFRPETTREIDNTLIKHRTADVQQRHQQHRPSSLVPPQSQYYPSPQSPFYNSPAPPHPQPQHIPFYPIASPPPPTFPSNYQQPPAQQSYSQPIPYPQDTYSPPPQLPNNYQPPLSQNNSYSYPSGYPAPQPPTHQPANLSLTDLLHLAGSVPQPQHQQQPSHVQPSPPPQQQQPHLNFPGLDALFKHQKPPEHPPPAAVPSAYVGSSTPQPPTSTATPVHLFTPPLKPAALSSVPTLINNDAKLTAASLKINRPALLTTLYSDRPKQCNTCGRRFAATAEGQARKSRHLDAHFRANRKIAQLEDVGGKGVSRSWFVDEADWIGAKEWDDADAGEPGLASTHATSGVDASSVNKASDGGAAAAEGASGIAGGRNTASSGPAGSIAKGSGGGSDAWNHQNYIKAPVDAALARYTCPICQEEFKAIWHDEAQEWVWMDAVRIGEKVYHGTCLGEMAKDGGSGSGSAGASSTSASARTGTPLGAMGVRTKAQQY